jgi:hypothetical protein
MNESNADCWSPYFKIRMDREFGKLRRLLVYAEKLYC